MSPVDIVPQSERISSLVFLGIVRANSVFAIHDFASHRRFILFGKEDMSSIVMNLIQPNVTNGLV